MNVWVMIAILVCLTLFTFRQDKVVNSRALFLAWIFYALVPLMPGLHFLIFGRSRVTTPGIVWPEFWGQLALALCLIQLARSVIPKNEVSEE